ncbi:nmrA-like family domain-containing protein 1 isoform X4 [Crassostrea angulata]|uniref:nmrA-like family domain-containing protein 1 isoform X4 n=1 Tax=Magallana angulata TaxID=2784310 RepID=UPI0005C37BBA|nr:nmrA-like family domain-containing protein 1 isoform X4 [Crassostrea angulata]|eukprot:XP_011440819.1 PREDICTED: nmrA-like family domain-containing protein 1 isoform X5 [Crassostrea gigas]
MFRLDWFRKDPSEKYRMGCGSSFDASDGPRTVVVFGSTGLLGGAIARRLLQEPFLYKVRCVTRRSSGEKARELAEHGAVIVNADLGETKSLEKALEGADIMFLTTHYWEEKNKEKEVIKGLNAIDAAIQCGVKHIIFNGSENVKKIIGKECSHLDSKSAIEEYIREVEITTNDIGNTTGINFTILRLPFWLENFYSVFKPHKLKHAVYAVALPLEGSELDVMSVEDVGEIVASILRRPRQYYGKTLNLSVESLSMENIVDTFNRHFDNRKFTDPKIRIKDMEKFQFPGSKDLAAMFEFYQSGQAVRDIKLTRKLNPHALTFDRWLSENRDKVEEALREAN